jgi:hypothetical protein
VNEKRHTWQHGPQPFETGVAQAVIISCLLIAAAALAGLAVGFLTLAAHS